MRNSFRWILASILSGLAVGLLTTSTLAAPPDQSSFAEVTIIDFAFQPNPRTVRLGDSVRWTNRGATTHTVTSDTGLFDSGNIPPGGTYQLPFLTPGTYNYHCKIHPDMKAAVVVQVAPTETATNTAVPATATNTAVPASPTSSPTLVATAALTSSPTVAASATPTLAVTATRTAAAPTVSNTATRLVSPTPRPTLGNAPQPTLPVTPTDTVTATVTPTNTACPCVALTPGAPGSTVGGANTSGINAFLVVTNLITLAALAAALIVIYNLRRARPRV